MSKSGTPLPFIITDYNVTVVVKNQPLDCNRDHPNYQAVIEAIKEEDWDIVPGLISNKALIKQYVEDNVDDFGDVNVDVENEIVTYKGEEIHGSVVEKLFEFARQRIDFKPLAHFINNLYQNPSATAVKELYGFLSKSALPITPDGYFLAYKRVNQNYTSVHDGKFKNEIGTWVEMPRNQVNDNRDETCSHGLHFCSFSYLGSFSGKRTVILKINPRDVVSIPSDYNDSKGRACGYWIWGEVGNDCRDVLKEAPPVVTDHAEVPSGEQQESALVSTNSPTVMGYDAGYRTGRAKKGKPDNPYTTEAEKAEWEAGFQEGRVDGKAHAVRKYVIQK
jgi:ribosome modulation factor